jgi:hypothetical protein
LQKDIDKLTQEKAATKETEDAAKAEIKKKILEIKEGTQQKVTEAQETAKKDVDAQVEKMREAVAKVMVATEKFSALDVAELVAATDQVQNGYDEGSKVKKASALEAFRLTRTTSSTSCLSSGFNWEELQSKGNVELYQLAMARSLEPTSNITADDIGEATSDVSRMKDNLADLIYKNQPFDGERYIAEYKLDGMDRQQLYDHAVFLGDDIGADKMQWRKKCIDALSLEDGNWHRELTYLIVNTAEQKSSCTRLGT